VVKANWKADSLWQNAVRKNAS